MHQVYIPGFDEYQIENSIQDHYFYKESFLGWKSEIGNGAVKKIHTRPGLTLIQEEFNFFKNTAASFKICHSPVEIHFCMSGWGKRLDEQGEQIKYDENHAGFYFASLLKNDFIFSPDSPLKLFTIRFSPDLLCPAIDGLDEILPMIRNGDLNTDHSIIENVIITPQMKAVLMQIISCPYKDAFKKIYLESKTMELIIMFFAQLNNRKSLDYGKTVMLTPGEIKRIHEAKSILLSNFENPPLLCQLARKVGMNKDKLNQGFQEVFGSTVFNTFRQQRLEEGKKLLESREMNVTEVAYALGYSQPGTFTRAFRQYFGINPKIYSKRMGIHPRMD